MSQTLPRAVPGEQKRILGSFVQRIEVQPHQLIIELDGARLRSILIGTHTPDLSCQSETRIRTIILKHSLKKRGVEARLVLTGAHGNSPSLDPHLIRIVARARLWHEDLTSGRAGSINELARQQNEDRNEISRFLSLAWLAPDIIETILLGKQPVDLTVERLRRRLPLPQLWHDQRQMLGFAS